MSSLSAVVWRVWVQRSPCRKQVCWHAHFSRMKRKYAILLAVLSGSADSRAAALKRKPSSLSITQHAGVRFALLEASDGVGGRVRTDAEQGFLLDRGFQIFLTSYPECRVRWRAAEATAFNSIRRDRFGVHICGLSATQAQPCRAALSNSRAHAEMLEAELSCASIAHSTP